MRFPALILVPVLALGLTAAHAASLPDTGQDLCDDGNGSHLMVACTNASSGDSATYPRQDGRFGRDAKATAGTLVKVGGGAAGFDYSKVTNDGNVIVGDGAGVSLGAGSSDWACTRDNITELTWEVKTATNTDLRYSGHTYSWYSTNGSTNGGNAGTASLGTDSSTCQTVGRCDTEKFVADVNAAALCGYNDWRMPTQGELLTLVHAGTQNPSIDSTYFPNTIASAFWSGSSYIQSPAAAWIALFGSGLISAVYKDNTNIIYVRLVRGGSLCDSSATYTSATYCQSGTTPTPTITGFLGGSFESTPAGLSINPSTGAIDVAASALGTYAIFYPARGICPDARSTTMTITNTTPAATFSYSGSPYCQNTSNPLPTFGPGASAGIFSVTPAGLVFARVNTGEIDLASSAPGTYTVTNSIPASGTCSAVSATATVITNSAEDASFVYSSAAYSQSDADPTPTITGLPGGTFSSTPAGLTVNPSTGTINPASSTLGAYILSYTTNGTCPNTSSITMTII